MSGSDPWDAISSPIARRSPRPAADDWDSISAPAAKPEGEVPFQPAPELREVRQDASPSRSIAVPAGKAHDGDTFALADGRNARLLGVDAFELNQTGRSRSGALIDLGQQARNALLPYTAPGSAAALTGAQTYGRPVGTLTQDGRDAGAALLHAGLAVAEPQYLRGDPRRMVDYVQEDRLARLNRRGAHADTFQTPSSFRHDGADPVANPAQARQEGGADAVFWDDPTPAAGLPPKVADGYVALWQDMNSKPADLLAYAKANGFQLSPSDVEARYAARAKTKSPGSDITYQQAPRVLTDPRDGAFGAAVRGFADPFNVLDETGALVDTLVPGKERENLWNSDRRFGDVYANNLEQNRDILGFDDAQHPYARFGGQLVGGLVVPGASVEGVGFSAARNILRAGGTRAAAEAAARRAVVGRLATSGAVEGGVAGAGAGESWQDRAQGALVGAPAGGVLGGLTGVAAPKIAALVGKPFARLVGREGEKDAQALTDGALDAGKAGGENAAQAARAAPDASPVASVADPVAPPRAIEPAAVADVPEPAPGRPGALTGKDYVARFAQPYSVKDYVEQPPADRLGSAVIGPDGKLHAFRTNGSEKGHADEVGHYDFLHAVGPDEDAAFGSVTRYRGEIAVTRPSNPTPQQEAAFNQLAARAKREGLAIVDENPKPTIRDTDRAEFADYQREWDARQPMRAEPDPTIYGPDLTEPRTPDRIDVNARPRPVTAQPTEAQRAAQAAGVQPRDVLPLPANTVDGIAEAERIGAGRYETVRAPNERDTLEARAIPSPVDGTRTIPKRGPLDLVTWLRTQGGIKPLGGTLEAMGINNASRDLDFARGENRFGKLVSEDGLGIDVAAHDAWEKGFFPDHAEPPTISDFLDALEQTHTGRNRVFHPDDFEEVDRFEAARTQRYDVEKAQLDGAPLVNDRGEPVDMADLDRNSAPIHAYEEWGENAPNLAGNIRLDKLDSPQAIKRALAVTDQRVGGFDAATRGRITHAETEALASDLGMTADDLLKRRKGEAFNAEQALAARQILAKSGNEMVNMARRVARSENPGDADLAAFRKAWLRHVAIQEQVAGATAEAGRALSQFRATASSRAVSGDVLAALASGSGGSDRVREAANIIIDSAADPALLNKTAAKVLHPRFRDKLVEVWYNYLLSGPQTHAVNLVSNTLTVLGQIPEHAVAATIGAPRALLSRSRVDRVLFSEVGARSIGMLQGAKEGMFQAARTFVSGEPSDVVSKVEQQTMNAVSGVKGYVLRTPTRALSASDEFFKAIARRMELTGMAVRRARDEGLTGKEARDRVADLVANPSDRALAQSFAYARYLTFQQSLGPVGQSLSRATASMPVLKLIIPFTRTPTNIVKFATERSPMAWMMPSWRADFAAGGAQRDLALAKVAVGSGMMAMAMEMYSQGHITGGGPADPNAKGLERANGWQPYSLKVGDKYYSYQRLDPYAITLGVAADFADLQSHMTEKQQDEVAKLLVASTIKSLSEKTWFSGFSDAVQVLNDPDRYAGSWVRKMVGSAAVPSVMAQTARTMDPTLRDAQTILDAVRARVPELSKDVPARLDVWGRPMVSEGSVGPDFISPIWQSTDRKDPATLAALEAGATVNLPSKKIGDRQLSQSEYQAYAAAAGQAAHTAVTDLVTSPSWALVPKADRADEIDRLIRAARKHAKEDVFGGSGRRVSSLDLLRNYPPPSPPSPR